MKRSLPSLFLVLAACGGHQANNATGTQGTTPDCVSTTPMSNGDLLNACSDDTIVKIDKQSSVPRREDQPLPPLP
jgi:hypothetical protein